jgi:hypothetical protein
LNVSVEYFNPFRNVQIDPSVNLEELAKVAHSLGEVVGLGLRNLANCPVEMNLMPESTLRWRAFNEKKPYFLATLVLLAVVAGAIGFMYQKLAEAKEAAISDLEPQVQAVQDKVKKFKDAYGRFQKTQGEVNQITAWMESRYYWGDLLMELRHILIRSEGEIVKKYAAQKPGLEAGIWIEQLTMGTAAPANFNPAYFNSSHFNPANSNPGDTAGTQPATGGTPDQNSAITLVCRAVDLSGITGDSAADNEIVYAVERELKAAAVFDPKTVQPSAQISPVDPNGTFTFSITVTPQNPLKLLQL